MLYVDRGIYDVVAAVSNDQKVPRNLVLAIIHQESRGNPDAVGDGGHSIGLMQLHDEGAGAGMSVDDRRNIYRNITRGVQYFAEMVTRTLGLETALIAYNMGLAGWELAGKPSITFYSARVVATWQVIDQQGVETCGPSRGGLKWG